ncbi:hypothetical protein NKDENANG_01877 [Candidatus Entotheonellaceae bacterium PAL068K]
MTTTTYTLTCLSPVHVGTGTQLSKFDGAYDERQWVVIDLDAVLAHGVNPHELARDMSHRDFAWANWLYHKHLSPLDMAVYALPCPQDPEAVPIREAIKDYLQQPYLPGTSVKGALRTAVLTQLIKSQSLQGSQFQRQLEQGSRQWLSQSIERSVLGPSPNRNLMRAIQVVDSPPARLEHLAVGLAWTYTLRGNRLVEKREQGRDYKSFVEWLIPNSALRLDIRLDDFLFQETANRELQFRGDRERAVRHLASTCQAYTNALITSEKKFYGAYGPATLQEFYDELETTMHRLPEGAFLLNIGWGGGWEVKTLGDLIRTGLGPERFGQLRQKYHLGVARGAHQPAPKAAFPKTRRIAYEGGAARWPMGWIQLTPR